MAEYISGLVSVVMPTFKRSEKLTRAIESVLNQTYMNLELLLVNDNDPKDEYTQELINRVEKYRSDKRFRLILQEKHVNGAVARNVGIKAAQGEYIALLDDDDWWEKTKIEIQIREIEKLSSEWGGISCRIKRYNGDELVSIQPLYRVGNVYKDILMLISDFETGTLLLRHTALDQTRCFDEKLLRHQDLQLLVDFTFKYKLAQVDSPLHCRDISDAQNRPDVDKIIRTKKAFFESIKPIYLTLDDKEKKDVVLMHRAEIAYVQVRNKKYYDALKNLLPLLTSRKAFVCQVQKILEKQRSKNNARLS